MTTVSRLSQLRGWSVRCGSALIALLICASAIADPGKNVVRPSKQEVKHKKAQTVCYMTITGSLIPQPCERWGGVPTTAIPMTVIGDCSVEQSKK